MTLSDRDPTDGRSHTVVLPAGEFHYRVWDSAGPRASPAVLLHANAATCASWSRVAPALADRFRVYAPDLRGHGSSPQPGAYGLRETTDDVRAFLSALGLTRPLLVGHSWGAAVALVLAADGPPLLGLVLEDLPPAVSPAALDTHLRDLLRAATMPAAHLGELIAVVNPGWHPDDVASLADGLSSSHPETIRSLVRDGARTGPLLPLLTRVAAPVLLLRADPEHGGLLSDRNWDRARHLLPPGSTALDLPDTPHEIHRASFDRFTAVVRDFAGRCPTTRQELPVPPTPPVPWTGDPATICHGLDALLELPEFRDEPTPTEAEWHRRTYQRLTTLIQHEGGTLALVHDTARLHAVLEWAAAADPCLFHAAMLHVGVCTATMLELGRTGPYLDDLLHALDRNQDVGTILITELGRGSSHLDLATQARYHPTTRSFTLHTPDLGAAKLMAHVGSPGIAKTAIVYAQLLVGDRQCGVFPFAVRVRTTDGPGHGVGITMHSPVPAVPLDYAQVVFDGTPVPYDGWLRDSARITDTDCFEDPLPTRDQRLVRSLCFSANATMGAAVGLTAAARACIAVALRHARQRVTAGRLAPGLGVLSYSTQQDALYTALAEVFAASLLVDRAKSWHRERTPTSGDGPTWAPWTSVNRGLALAKAAATSALERTSATCRTRSGAQGLLTANRIVEYEGLAQIYQAAAGDNILIRMDAGKALVQDPAHQPRAHRLPAPLDLDDPAALRALAEAREAGLLDALRGRTASADPTFEVWNPLLSRTVELADAYLLGLTLDVFDDAIRAAPPGELADGLRALRTLYGLDTLRRDLAWHLEHGTLTAADAAHVHTTRDRAVAGVHHHGSTLLDALAIPAQRLHAPMAATDHTRPASRPTPDGAGDRSSRRSGADR